MTLLRTRGLCAGSNKSEFKSHTLRKGEKKGIKSSDKDLTNKVKKYMDKI